MKDYQKPEVELVNLTAMEPVTNGLPDPGMDDVSSEF